MNGRSRQGPPFEEVAPSSRAFLVRMFGDEARAWLERVPRLLDAACLHLGVEVVRELPGGLLASTWIVATADGRGAVLKVPSPWGRGEDELAALRVWAGRGAPAILAHDPATGARLLERIEPGSHAVGAGAAEVAAVLTLLHQGPSAGLPTLEETVARRLDRAEEEGRATPERLSWARTALQRRCDRARERVLLHGDFDHRNLLVCRQRGLCAIDPLPCVGDPAYDAGYWAQAAGLPGRRLRVEGIAEAAGFEVERVRDWCAIVAVHG